MLELAIPAWDIVLRTAVIATADQFRTGWFLESVITELLILLVIRTRRPFFKSRPGKYLAEVAKRFFYARRRL